MAPRLRPARTKASIIPATINAGTDFLKAFTKYVRIDISCKHINEDNPHELLELTQVNLKSLCKALVANQGLLHGVNDDIAQWPGLFVVSSADGLTSRKAMQDRGCFLLGIYHHKLHFSSAKLGILKDWQKHVKSQPLFKDYYPPLTLEIHLVEATELGHLVLDEWMWPEALLDAKPLRFSKDALDGEESFAYLDGMRQYPLSMQSEFAAPIPETTTASIERPTTKKLTPSTAILKRLKWDDEFESKDYAVVYEDRNDGLMEIDVDQWTYETTEEHFIPTHRIRSIKNKTNGMTVWHREERIDLISG